MAEVSFQRVSKRFGEVEAVRELTLDVADGELLVVVGPSGSGKTTAGAPTIWLDFPYREEPLAYDGSGVSAC